MVRNFEFQETEISGLVKIVPFRFEDARGCLLKTFSQEVFEKNGWPHDFSKELVIEKNHAGVIRGLHVQRVKPPAKLASCVSGRLWAAVIDLRKDSPSFGKWQGFDLSAVGGEELLIPGGCAMGYLALEASVFVCQYSEKFYPEYDGGIRWDDPELGVEWPLETVGGLEKVILSDKDRNLQSFRAFMEAYGGL